VDIGVLVKNFNSNHFLFGKNPLNSVEILSPEANLSSSHKFYDDKTKTTSFRRSTSASAAPSPFVLLLQLQCVLEQQHAAALPAHFLLGADLHTRSVRFPPQLTAAMDGLRQAV
jgi:hypothetical protein